MAQDNPLGASISFWGRADLVWWCDPPFELRVNDRCLGEADSTVIDGLPLSEYGEDTRRWLISKRERLG